MYLKLDDFTGRDYKSGPYFVEFKRGETRKYFTIPITDDSRYEGEEYFTIYIDDPPHGVVLGYPKTGKVTIEDDECKYIPKMLHYC